MLKPRAFATLSALLLVPLSWLTVAPPPAAAADSWQVSPSTSWPAIEQICGPAQPGEARCFALRRTDIAARPAIGLTPLASPPSGFGPADLQDAYGVTGNGGGTGLTVAIVDAYDLPTAESDLAVYRSQYGLPPCTTANGCFKKVNQAGATSPLPMPNSSWGYEIALDLAMVSAICPNCKILLVEADSANADDLAPAVDTAVAKGAMAVSNSYGLREDAGSAYESHYDHPGVAITVSTGDCGFDCAPLGNQYYEDVEFPASSPHVVAVGGTSLVRDGSPRGWSESAWGDVAHEIGAGSGCSSIFAKPSWQHDAHCSHRMLADVSAVSDPYATGVAVYDSGFGGWSVAGGTSAASPLIAGMFALAGTPRAGTYPASYIYADAADLNDVTTGSNKIWSDTYTPCPYTYFCNGVTGYDGPTGLGTPNGTGAFSEYGPPGKPLAVYATAQDRRATVNWSPPADDGGKPITKYTVTSSGAQTCEWTSGPLSCTVTGLTNGTPYTFTVTATNEVGTGPESDASTAVTPHAGATYYTVEPYRVLDSRYDIGGSQFVSQIPQTVTIATTESGVPADAVAVTGNVTVVGQTRIGYVTVAPSLTAHLQPPTSTLNFPVGDVRANNLTVPLAADGKLDFMYWSSGTTDRVQVIFDVTGYFMNDSGGSSYYTVEPYRVLDSRYGIGGSQFVSQIHQTVLIATTESGVPTDAVAVTGNVTIVGQTYRGYITVAPTLTDHLQPPTSTLNFPAGDIRANGITVPLAAGGNLDFMYWSTRTSDKVQVIFDVTGYFLDGLDGATYFPVTPARVMDSRYNIGASRFSAQIKQTVLMATSLTGVPTDAVAVTGNATVTGQTYRGYITVAPTLTDHLQPPTSTLNFPVGDNRANGVTVPVAAGANLDFIYWSTRTSDKAQVIFDVTGYFWQPPG